ncbi:complex III assembly factor LYRM7-like [Amphiura filiformis]|uniref:complex III assembly factor LYRM7-like n=1 Tax=Amphiura filiformis TaxID=82378 RepID=UPI003B223D82
MRDKVIACFRALHRARRVVFEGDERALDAARIKINEEFSKNKSETDPEKIQEFIKIAEDAENLLKKTVVQAREKEGGKYELRITKDTVREDNAKLPPEVRNTKPSNKKR